MKLRQLHGSKKTMVAFLFISVFLCINSAVGITLDVYVSYEGIPVPNAAIYIDDNPNPVGYTLQDGVLKNIMLNPGFHLVKAVGEDNHGNTRTGMDSFRAEDAHVSKKIILT